MLSKAFPNQLLLVDVLLYPLHLNWIVFFSALLWNDSCGFCKNEYTKIKFKTADDVSFAVEPDQACSSHGFSGKDQI